MNLYLEAPRLVSYGFAAGLLSLRGPETKQPADKERRRKLPGRVVPVRLQDFPDTPEGRRRYKLEYLKGWRRVRKENA